MIIIEGTTFEKSGGYTAYLKASGTSDKRKTIIKEYLLHKIAVAHIRLMHFLKYGKVHVVR